MQHKDTWWILLGSLSKSCHIGHLEAVGEDPLPSPWNLYSARYQLQWLFAKVIHSQTWHLQQCSNLNLHSDPWLPRKNKIVQHEYLSSCSSVAQYKTPQSLLEVSYGSGSWNSDLLIPQHYVHEFGKFSLLNIIRKPFKICNR